MTLTRIDIDLTEQDLRRSLIADAGRGLMGEVKVLPPKYFYDERGSDLFECITLLPEYYPTRVERSILSRCASQIVAAVPGCTSLVELGSGASSKTPLLLEAMGRVSSDVSYTPVDVSLHAIAGAIGNLREAYPRLPIHGSVRDFERPLDDLPHLGTRMLVLLGSTIGNLDPQARATFLTNVTEALAPGESLLLGVDLVKDARRLTSAYDDAAGVTRLFNINMLNVLNRLLRADFNLERFDHVAIWDEGQSRVEMRLRARTAMKVQLGELEASIAFEEGEELRTEISTKFRRAALEQEIRAAGLAPVGWWDSGEEAGGGSTADYAVVLAVRP